MDSVIHLKRIDNSLVLDLIGNRIDNIEFDLYLRYIKTFKNVKKLYINLSNLSEINNDTILKFHKLKSMLLNIDICVMNVNASNNTILNLFKIDKMFQIYMNKEDAFDNIRPVINRQFKLA